MYLNGAIKTMGLRDHLKDVEGYSQEEIAVIIKRPVGTVKARISRGRMMLRKSLEKASENGSAYATREISDERC